MSFLYLIILITFLIIFLLIVLPFFFDAEIEIDEDKKSCFFKISIAYKLFFLCYHVKKIDDHYISFGILNYKIFSFKYKKSVQFIEKLFSEQTYIYTEENLQSFLDFGNFFIDKRLYLKKIINCLHIQIHGKLVLGLDDPYYTGNIFGLLQSLIDLIPANHQLEIKPDFSRSCLFTHTKVKARIWLPELAIYIISGFILSNKIPPGKRPNKKNPLYSLFAGIFPT